MTYKKKLIEVAMPLNAINEASRREKSPFTRNHPRAIHVWWARRPLAACRAVLFASLVDDPSSDPVQFPTIEDQKKERSRLFELIEKLVKWENIHDESMLKEVLGCIAKSTNGNPPAVLDPFCGAGSIPLEAQRLGLLSYASDLNPIAVLITKALIEIPPKFAGHPPVNPSRKNQILSAEWQGLKGLIDDIRYYGDCLYTETEKKIGYIYPKVRINTSSGKQDHSVKAWIWARAVKCPNPACGAIMPLVSTFWLVKHRKEKVWIQPNIDKTSKSVRFTIQRGDGEPKDPSKIGRGAKFKCLVCDQIADEQYIRDQFIGKHYSYQLMAMVCDSDSGRVYLAPSEDQISAAQGNKVAWHPEQEMNTKTPNLVSGRGYGINYWYEIFTSRQLIAITSLIDALPIIHSLVLTDALNSGLKNDGKGINEGGNGAQAYADAITTYLSLSISRFTDFSNALCSWDAGNSNFRQLFARQAIPMAWDFAETNVLDGIVNIKSALGWTISALQGVSPNGQGIVKQLDAVSSINGISKALISTDPPYYDNISYADLSDFFYIWLRPCLNQIYPDLFSTLLVPKAQELVADRYRFDGDKNRARHFFESGFREVFNKIHGEQHPDYPFTVYYAFKQSESSEEDDTTDGPGTTFTGWETMLEGLLQAGFTITGTWPMSTEQQQRSIAIGSNALASSIVLVCRARSEKASIATRKELLSSLKKELPDAIKKLQHGNIAPVDLAQAAIGPGMAIYSRFSKVIEADGASMTVRTALQLINHELDSCLAQQEGEMDRDTRFCLSWFDQHGINEGLFGEAEVLTKAKDISVQGIVDDGVAYSKGGKFRLLKRSELDKSWDPATDKRLTIWECTQHLIRILEDEGEEAAAKLAATLGGGRSEEARDLAYRLYSICEKKKWAEEARAYNSLVTAWPEITKLAQKGTGEPKQGGMNI